MTRNGGRHNAATDTASHRARQRGSRPASHIAATRPSATESAVVTALTSRLFWSNVQFIQSPDGALDLRLSQKNVLQFRGGGIEIAEQGVPIHFEARVVVGNRGRFGFDCVRLKKAVEHWLALEVIEETLGFDWMGRAAQQAEG